MKKVPFELLPAPQKYLTMQEIRDTYGKLGVLAHSCPTIKSAPQGGYVFAVAKETGKGRDAMKQLQRRMKEKHPNLRPIFYFCLDDGMDFVEAEPAPVELAPIVEKEHPIVAALRNLPDEFLAKAVSTTVIKDE